MMTTEDRRFLLLWLLAIAQIIAMVSADCTLAKKDGSKSEEILKRLDPIKGKIFKFTYKDESDQDKYEYHLAICTPVADVPNVGIVQEDLSSKSQKVVGKISNTTVKAGTDWIMLTYRSGDKYHKHCQHESRQGHIMIMCNANVEVGNFAVLYEENLMEQNQDCYYMMEMESKYACSDLNTGLSTGSIILIVMACLIAAYLGFGMVYKRCVHGSKGVEQVPNIGFWRACGSLQADGCDFMCRCQESGFDSSRPYRGIADDQLDDDADDENLLPM